MIEHADLEDAWRLLDFTEAIPDREYRVYETDTHIDSGRVLLALDTKGARRLLVPLSKDVTTDYSWQSGGIKIITHELIDEDARRLFADVICLRPHLNWFFTILSLEILKQLERGLSDPLITCIQVIEQLKDLVKDDSEEQTEVDSVTGLFGELWHLRELVNLNPKALNAWRGPYGERHDFKNDVIALEVKTTLSKQGSFFIIHGHDQLEPPLGGTLYLVTTKLEKKESGGETVNDLVSLIQAHEIDNNQFLSKLRRVGYSELRAVYSTLHFTVVENKFYEVSGDFPRIISDSFIGGSLPAGTLRLEYQINLGGLPLAGLPENARQEIYKKLTG